MNPTPDPRPRGTETVLLVDDDASGREPAVRILEKFGYTVLAVDNALDALAILRDATQHIDLIITDLRMPGMTGADLLSTLPRDAPTIAVLVVSGSDHMDPGFRAVLKGVPFLKKPWTVVELLEAVRSAIDRASGRSARLGGEETT